MTHDYLRSVVPIREASLAHLGTGEEASRGALLSLLQFLPHPLGASLGPHLPVDFSFHALGFGLCPRPRLDMVAHISLTSISICLSVQGYHAPRSLAGCPEVLLAKTVERVSQQEVSRRATLQLCKPPNTTPNKYSWSSHNVC